MIKLVLFDLDGVLIDAKQIHYKALNEALGEYAISEEEHVNIYDGRKTTEKLEKLTERKGLPKEEHSKIWQDKQNITMHMIQELKPNEDIVDLFELLEKLGYKIGVCSNSIRRTTLTALAASKLISYCSVIISNEDVVSEFISRQPGAIGVRGHDGVDGSSAS